MADPKEWKEWLAHPLTQELLSDLDRKARGLASDIRAASDWPDFRFRDGMTKGVEEVIDDIGRHGEDPDRTR